MRTLLALLAALIIYGSLYPFDFSLASAHGWTWQSFLSGWNSLGTRADAIGNVLLFVPFGFVSHAVISHSSRPKQYFWSILIFGLAIALGVQIFQIFLPTRDAALFDVWWNIAGFTAGYWTSRITLPLTRFHWESSPLAGFALFVLCLWIAAELIPFVPSLDLQSIKDGIKPLFQDPEIRIARLMFHATGIVVAGRLLSILVSKERNLLALLAFLALIWAGKVIVVSTNLSLSMCLGTIIGFVLWLVIRNRPEPGRNVTILFIVLFTYCALSLTPFSLRSSPGSFSWVPFAGLLEGSMRANLHGLIERMSIYASIIWLVQANSGRVLTAGVWLSLWVWLMEGAQTWVVGRSGSFTEPLLVILLSVVAYRLQLTKKSALNPVKHT